MRVTQILQRSTGVEQNYELALEILMNRRRRIRPTANWSAQSSDEISSKRMPSLNGTPTLKGRPSVAGMAQWLEKLGHSEADVNALNIIHVAGTKGKGSTCAFAECFLRAYGKRKGFPKKTGLYTSPHLMFPEERIRINFQPLPRTLFVKYFFEVYNCLFDPLLKEIPETSPRILQLWALLSFHSFIREGVDAAVYETHNGGEYDATNVIQRPIVTAITTLGMDHVKQLGPSLENIAWHKAGIFKAGVPAFSTVQEPAAAMVLEVRAIEKSANLTFVDVDPRLPVDALQLKPDVQRRNCSLALAAVNSFLKRKRPEEGHVLIREDIIQGVRQFTWPGRFQLVVDGDRKWFLDGAHNEMSVDKAAQWFAESASPMKASGPNILIFSHISSIRDGVVVLERLAQSLQKNGVKIQHVIFSTYTERDTQAEAEDQRLHKASSSKSHPEQPEPPEETHEAYIAAWNKALLNIDDTNTHALGQNVSISVQPTIKGALQLAKEIAARKTVDGGMQALITGSQHLVGGALRLLNYK